MTQTLQFLKFNDICNVKWCGRCARDGAEGYLPKVCYVNGNHLNSLMVRMGSLYHYATGTEEECVRHGPRPVTGSCLEQTERDAVESMGA